MHGSRSAVVVLGAVAVLLLASQASACKDAICGTVPGEHTLDKQNYPPTQPMLGRAAWTFLHATAAYLPKAQLTAREKNGMSYIVNAFSFLYPSPKGQKLWRDIVNSPSVLNEFNGLQTREDAVLWVWMVHNCITAHVDPEKPMYPNHDIPGLKRSDFVLAADGSLPFKLASLPADHRRMLLASLKHRWVLAGGLDTQLNAVAKMYNTNLPPDRAGLGRATWTMLHTFTVYLPAMLNLEQRKALAGLVDALHLVYACPICRHHFQTVYPDKEVQQELHAVNTREGAILFFWKLHNIVTAERHPEKGLFPKSAHQMHMDMFHVPDNAKHQLQLSEMFTTYNKTFGLVMWKYQQRWKIVGGLDQSLDDFAPSPPCSYVEGRKVLRIDMFIMAMCPFCATTMKKIVKENIIGCDLKCPTPQGEVTGTVELTTHYVGMRNGTHLMALHGPHEEAGDKLEICARQHYAKDYQYLKFIACMDKNITLMPTLAQECAHKTGIDFNLISKCANDHGHDLLATSFAFASSRGVDMTPTFLLNDHKRIVGLKKNMTAIMCHEMLTHDIAVQNPEDRQWLQQIIHGREEAGAREAAEHKQQAWSAEKMFSGLPLIIASTGMFLFLLTVIIWKIRSHYVEKEEMQSLLDDKARRRRDRQGIPDNV